LAKRTRERVPRRLIRALNLERSVKLVDGAGQFALSTEREAEEHVLVRILWREVHRLTCLQLCRLHFALLQKGLSQVSMQNR